ncbi:MAG: cytochrome C oxidase subunit II [SAR324 cluster bacterium]|nr:cytochrome C oxidase subunit II [SAR324 cluster bacterium]
MASRLEVMGGIKSKLHTYFNQGMQNMLNRYLVTVEDEMGKKVRDLVDLEEMRGLNRYTPRAISYLLNTVGGAEKFNTGEVEKSIINIFGHLHGHIQREMNDLETFTNSLLRRKTDVGAFVRGENAYAIVKCSFRDHYEKPTTVYEVKLSLNIMDSELISAIFPYQESMNTLIRNLVSKRISDAVEKELVRINENLVDEGKAELTPEEKIFERVKALDNYVSDDENESSRRYTFLAKKFFDAIEGLQAEISSTDFDALGVRENVFKLFEDENVRNRGYNTAVNAITHVLDWSRMGYQLIENYKTSRHCHIREYEDTDMDRLPDERYQLNLTYYDARQIQEMREAYITQLAEFQRTIHELWEVVERIYVEHRDESAIEDWTTLSRRLLEEEPGRRSWFARILGDGDGEDEPEQETVREKAWNELTFVAPEENLSTAEHPTLEHRFLDLKARFPVMKERQQSTFAETTPEIREVVDARLEFLESEFNKFASLINPFHLQSGLLLDMDMVSIKRKSTTMMMMANVLNEFIYAVSEGFSDSAFAEFSRRRSTQRDDMEGEFGSEVSVTSLDTEGEEVFE